MINNEIKEFVGNDALEAVTQNVEGAISLLNSSAGVTTFLKDGIWCVNDGDCWDFRDDMRQPIIEKYGEASYQKHYNKFSHLLPSEKPTSENLDEWVKVFNKIDFASLLLTISEEEPD